jgi:hypothetical protein
VALFSAALALLNFAIAVRRDPSGVAVAILLALTGALGAWYARRSVRAVHAVPTGPTGRTAAGDHLLLSKYAAMVVIVAGARTARAPVQILGAALAIHLAACLYEAWHDPASPLPIGGPRWHR